MNPSGLVRANIKRSLNRMPTEELRRISGEYEYPDTAIMSVIASEIIQERATAILERSEEYQRDCALIGIGRPR